MVTDSGIATVQVNDVLPEITLASLAITVTAPLPVSVGVPVMDPVEVLIDKPAGRPVADHVYGVVPPIAVLLRLTVLPVAVA